jgi:DNA-binding PadR family transcriptional regulator
MSATRLLVLAFVRAYGRAHGYMVGQELMAWHANEWANTKTGSIYHALRQLTKEGLLEEHDLAGGKGSPARTDYSITAKGEKEFQALMEQALTVSDPKPDMLCAGLVLMSALPRKIVIDYLSRRRTSMQSHAKRLTETYAKAQWSGENALPAHVDAVLGYWQQSIDSDAAWLNDLIAGIERGDYVFADEDPSVFGTPGSRTSRL